MSKTNERVNKAWINEWKIRNHKGKVGCTIGLIISVVILVTAMILSYEFGQPLFPILVVAVILTLATLFIFINSFACHKVHYKNIEGYDVIVYKGFKCFLVVEGVIQDKGYGKNMLYGKLPNDGQIWTSINYWNSVVTIGTGESGKGEII